MHVETESLRNELKRSKEAYSTERINSANIRREFDLAAKRSDRISRTTEKITQQCKDQIANKVSSISIAYNNLYDKAIHFKDKTIQELNDRIRNLTYKNMQLQAKMVSQTNFNFSFIHFQYRANFRIGHRGCPTNCTPINKEADQMIHNAQLIMRNEAGRCFHIMLLGMGSIYC